jgi:hypothetical protein
VQQQVFKNGTKAQCREEGKRADDENDASQQDGEQSRIDGKRSWRRRHALLLRQVAGKCDHRHHHQEAVDEHRESKAQVVPVGVGAQSGEGGPIVSCSGSKGVKNLAQAVWAIVREAAQSHLRRKYLDGGKHEDDQGEDEHIKHGHLHVVGFDLLAEIFWRAPHHQSRDKDG